MLPLELAWCVTIHKSQGMSVDTLVIILGSFFARGLTYVARSRVRSFEGLHIVPTVQHQELSTEVMNLFADQSEVIHAEYIRLRRFLRPEGMPHHLGNAVS